MPAPSGPPNRPLGRPLRLAAFISGGGSTVLNLHKTITEGRLDAEIVAVLASRPDCRGVGRCHEAGLPCDVVARRDFADRDGFSDALFAAVDAAGADLVVLAGFLSLITIPDRYAGRVMNIHPSLIPAFAGQGYYGGRVHEAAIARGVKVSGCTVHFADNEYDHGPIILQKTVPVGTDDDAHTLAARVQAAEAVAFPEAVALFAAGRLVIRDGRVDVRPG
ncbi:MAG: phosphoribosylglycinamide formyltransferase [Planctomycetota bacterium]